LKNAYKEHRTVILPDYQGVGIGTAFTDYIAQHYKDNGKIFISTTSSPSMIHSRVNNTKWITTRIGRSSSGSGSGKIQNKNKKGSTSCNRITMSFKYIGK
jgi:GNAT superfamily N-acetyltransferase